MSRMRYVVMIEVIPFGIPIKSFVDAYAELADVDLIKPVRMIMALKPELQAYLMAF